MIDRANQSNFRETHGYFASDSFDVDSLIGAGLSGTRKLPGNHRRKRGGDQSTELGQSRSRRRWLDADVIIDGIAEPLFAAEIPLSCLDAHVTEQELDLFKLPPRPRDRGAHRFDADREEQRHQGRILNILSSPRPR
ncbi:MAG: hypothetical protein LAQ69_50835 [Acidobacteriia bacterium]|nr:hypothetical protein [Terriglobia bacterium]